MRKISFGSKTSELSGHSPWTPSLYSYVAVSTPFFETALMKFRRAWGIYPSTGQRGTSYNHGKEQQVFPGTHSTPARFTLNVNWCVRNAASLWLHVRPRIYLVARFSVFPVHSLSYTRKDRFFTGGLHLCLRFVRIRHHEREAYSFQVCG